MYMKVHAKDPDFDLTGARPCPDGPRSADDFLRLASDLEDAGRETESLEACEKGLAFARARREHAAVLDLLVQQNRVMLNCRPFREVVAGMLSGLPLVARVRRRESVVNYLSFLGLTFSAVGDVANGLTYLRLAHSAAVLGSTRDRFRVAARFGEARILSGTPRLAIQNFRDAVKAVEEASAAVDEHPWLGPYDVVVAHLGLAQTLAATALDDGDHDGEGVLEADRMIEKAAARIDEVPALAIYFGQSRDLVRRLLGQTPDPSRPQIMAMSAERLRAVNVLDLAVTLKLIDYEARCGDLDFASTMLAKLDPTGVADRVPWRLSWYEAMANLQRSRGEHAAANETYERYLRQAKADREHQIAIVATIADTAAAVEEARRSERLAEQRQRRARSRAERLAAEISSLARTAAIDPLTKLANRRSLDQAVARLEAEPTRGPYTVILADIDHFKRVNDGFSHLVGDKVLVAFAELLGSRFRRGDIVGRFGGEEFLILARGALHRDVLERVRRSVAEYPWTTIAPGLAVTASFGMAPFEPGGSFADAIAVADRRVYSAKSAGRNKVVDTDEA